MTRSSTHFAMIVTIFLLTGCGDEQSRVLTDLQSTDTASRRRAAQMVFEKKWSDPPVIQTLTTTLGDVDVEVRRWSCRALGDAGPEAAQGALSKLEGCLRDTETPVRRAAAFALQKLAPESDGYRMELMAAIKSGDGGVIVALPTLKPLPTWATLTLIDVVQKDRRPGLRRLAVEALGHLGVHTDAVQTALDKATRDTDDRVREAAEQARSELQMSPPPGS